MSGGEGCATSTEASWGDSSQPDVALMMRSAGSTLPAVSTPSRGRAGSRIGTASVAGSSLGMVPAVGRVGGVFSRPTLSLVGPLPSVRSVAPRKRLVAALDGKRGRPLERHRQATRLVVDDYGDAVGVQLRCSSCMRWQSQYATGWCRDCQRFANVQRRLRDPDAAREAAREARRRLLERDPTALERERARHKAGRQARLERDAERERALQAAGQRRYRQRLRQDPVRWREWLELQRIDARLRREARGLATGGGRHVNGTCDDPSWVVSKPLVVAVDRAVRRFGLSLDVICDRAQVSVRLLYRWRVGECRLTHLDVAERVLRALDALWWDVFEPADHPGVFSGIRSRDVVAWCEAGLRAAECWGDG